MKSLSRILMICLCSAPIIHGAWGVVATNSGSNLTSFNPSNAYNNQWATMSNGRNDVSATPAKANFGNCNSLILRCAQPKCGNGGCTDMNVAAAIVNGCVQSNKSCEKYGDDLVAAISGQLVASSTAKVNSQNAAAAQAANAAQQEQMTAMQAQMQAQMAAMQQQMAQQSAQIAQQNEQTQQQIQAAMEAQAQQNKAALNDMAAAATTAAQQQQQTSGLTAYQEEAVSRGISDDVLARQTITGQIMTSIEDAQLSLKDVKTAMVDAFEYAHCDTRGNNCEGPKRVKKFRERALAFIDPYDTVIDKIYDALLDAQTVGVDLSDIYLMLNNSCNRWGQYLCPQGTVAYETNEKTGQQRAPQVCDTTAGSLYDSCLGDCNSRLLSGALATVAKATCYNNCIKNYCHYCTLLKTFASNDSDGIYYGWINAETTSPENQTVVACASSALDDSYIGRRSRRKRGAGVGIDIDQFELWLSQVEPTVKTSSNGGPDKFKNYCRAKGEETILKKATLSKSIDPSHRLCVKGLDIYQDGSVQDDIVGYDVPDGEYCSYINRIYALCDTHMYNADYTDPKDMKNSENRSTVKNIVALKTTVIAQQMYKQYEFLAATLRRLQVQLEKSVLTANIQAAGGFSSGSSSDDGGSGQYINKNESIYLSGAGNCYTGDTDTSLNCLQSNLRLILDSIKQRKQACQQLVATVNTAEEVFNSIPDRTGATGTAVKITTKCDEFKNSSTCNKSVDESKMRNCINGLTVNISTARQAVERNRNQGRWGN